MPEAGGPTTQSGILYQNAIAVLYLGRLCDAVPRPDYQRVIHVRVEAPEDVDDTVVTFAVHPGPPYLIDGQNNYGMDGGDLVVVPMICESGHAWEICFGFHKGGTYTFIRHLSAKSDEEGDN